MRAPQSVPGPRVDPLVLENLFDGEPELLERGADLDDLCFARVRGEGIDVSGSTISGCEFNDLVADEFSVVTARVSQSRFTQLAVPYFRVARSVLRDVEFIGGRLGAIEAYDAQCRAVIFRGCRLSYVNLRGSTLTDVAFTDCQIDELDLGQANVERMRFQGSRIGVLALHQATLTDVDLRGAALEIVNGAASLKGATISPEQLMGLAPQLAREFGIGIAESE